MFCYKSSVEPMKRQVDKACLLGLAPSLHEGKPELNHTFFLGAFAKLRNATISFVMFVCPPVCPHGTIRLDNVTLHVHFLSCYFARKYSVRLIAKTAAFGQYDS